MAYEINIISFKTQNISTGRVFHTNNIVGNVGEKIRVTIEAQCDEIPNLVTQTANALIQYVLKPKSSPPYAPGSPTHIPNVFFKNIHSNGVATLLNNRILGTELNVFASEKHGQLVESPSDFKFEIYDVDLIRYEFDMYILPAITPSDFVGGVYSIPTYFSGAECLTLYFYLQIADFEINVAASVNDVDLSSYFSSGNTGFYNEWLNIGSEYFTLSTWTPPATIDPTLTQTYTAQITQTASGAVAPALNFVADSQIKVMFLQLKDDNVWDVSKTYMENIEFHVLDALANNTVFSSSKIIDFTANAISVDTVNISFKIVANALSVGKRYVLWFNVGVKSTDGFWATQNTQPHLIYGEQGSSLDTFDGQMYFSHWDLDPPAPLFTGLRSFRSDDGVAYFQLNNTQPALNVIQSFTFGFKNKTTNIPLASELFTVALTSLPYTQTRGRVRNSANLRNVINFSEISPNNYQLDYGFQAWDGWADANDIVFFCAINVVSNGILDVVEFQSPFIEVGQFATTKNSAAEPQALPLSVEFFVSDAAGNVLIPTAFDNPIAGENHLIVATWQDNNLNDLQTTDVIGYLGVCAGTLKTDRSRWRYFFSEYDPESDTPFRAPLGHTSNRSKAEVIAIDKATVSAVLIWDDYVRIFGAVPACFDFRLDKKDPPAPVYATQKYLIWHFRNDQDYCEITLTEPIGFIAQFSFNGFLGSPPTGTLFKINGTTLPYSAFLLALPTLTIGDVLRIEVQTSSATPYGTDWIFALLVGTFSIVAAGFKDYEIQFVNPDIAQPNVGCDAIMCFDEKIEFNPDVAAHDGMYVDFSINPPSYDDYTSFRYFLKTALDITTLNAGIAALPLGTKYALRFWAGHTGSDKFPNAGWQSLTTGNINRKFSYRFIDFDDTREILAYRGETSQPRYAFKLGGDGAIGNQLNGLVYDGSTTWQRLSGIPKQHIRLGKRVVWHFSFFCTSGARQPLFGSITYLEDGISVVIDANRIVLVFVTGGGLLLRKEIGAPIKIGFNTVTIIWNGQGIDANNVVFCVNGAIMPSFNYLSHWSLATYPLWTGEAFDNRFAIGSYFVNFASLGIANGSKLKQLMLWSGAALPLPTAIELRTMFNDKGMGNNPYTEGEPYDPLPSTEFYMKVDFGKAGVSPITVDSSVPIAVLMQGATSYANFLNP